MQTLRPGVTYEDTDEVVAEIKKQTERLRSTPSLKATLDSLGVPYEEKACRSCGGRIIKLEFCPIVEVE